jgi:IS5 family transposase
MKNLPFTWRTPMLSVSSSRLEMGQYPSKSILQENIKAIGEETEEAIHAHIIGYTQREKIKTGRIDSTAVKTDIYHLTDSTPLADSICVLSPGGSLRTRSLYQYRPICSAITAGLSRSGP